MTNDADMSGVTLPALAERDDARLLVQSPHTLFLYWSFARDPRAALGRALGASAALYEAGARLVDLEHDTYGDPVAARNRELWFDAQPHRTYRAEIGFFAAGLPFVRVLVSNVVQTPANTVSALTDDALQFHVDAADFQRLLLMSGAGNAPSPEANNVSGEFPGAAAEMAVAPFSSFALPALARSSFVFGVGEKKLRD